MMSSTTKRLLSVVMVVGAFASREPAQAAIPPIEACGVNVNCLTVRLEHLQPPLTGYAIGDGVVTSQPPGLECTFRGTTGTGRCEHQFTWPIAQPQLVVVLSRTAAANSIGGGPITLALGAPAAPSTFSHSFFFLARYQLEVSRSGAGTGRVTTSAGGIDCGAACKATFNHGTAVSVSALPDAGAEFRGWTGACAGQGATCSLTITQMSKTNAVFELKGSDDPQPPQPPQQPPQPPLPQPRTLDTTVDVDVLGHRMGRSLLGFRLVQVELELDESLGAAITLSRGRTPLVTKRLPKLRPGRRVVTLVLPKRVAKGSARLVLTFHDADGNTRTWSRSLQIPRSGR